MALRGVRLITAMTMLAEMGNITRFDSPRQLMAYLGLVPNEHTSGSHRRQGAITKTGNGHVRRVLVEAAWSYRFAARTTPEVHADCLAGPKAPVRALPAADRSGEDQTAGHHNGGARAGRRYLGHRLPEHGQDAQQPGHGMSPHTRCLGFRAWEAGRENPRPSYEAPSFGRADPRP